MNKIISKEQQAKVIKEYAYKHMYTTCGYLVYSNSNNKLMIKQFDENITEDDKIIHEVILFEKINNINKLVKRLGLEDVVIA